MLHNTLFLRSCAWGFAIHNIDHVSQFVFRAKTTRLTMKAIMRIFKTARVFTTLVDDIAHLRQLVLGTKTWFLPFKRILGLFATIRCLAPLIHHIHHTRQLVLCAACRFLARFTKHRALGALMTPFVDNINHT